MSWDARTHDDVHATAHNAKPSHAKPRHSDAARYRATLHRDVELEKGFVRLWFDFTLFSVGMRASVAVRYTSGWLTLVVFLAVSLWWRVSCPLIVFFLCAVWLTATSGLSQGGLWFVPVVFFIVTKMHPHPKFWSLTWRRMRNRGVAFPRLVGCTR